MKIITGVSLILGCFFGAGFVSGREIAFYYSRFGNASILSIFLSTILFFLLIFLFFILSKKCNSVHTFCTEYFGRISGFINGLLSLSLLIISSSMIAGTRSLANVIKVNDMVIVGITLVLAFCVVVGNIKTLSNVNMILMPMVIVVLIIVVWCPSIISDNSTYNLFAAIISGGNYVFINIVTLGMFILEIGQRYSKTQQLLISICSSVIIGIMTFIVSRAIINNDLIGIEMPNLILSQRNSVLYLLMQVSIYIGLFTTLIANVLLLSNFINKYVRNFALSVGITLFMSFVLSLFGFEIIVGYIYSLIGIIGLFMLIGVINIKKRRFKIFS